MAEACANRTHPGRSSRPTTVLKTAGPTRNHPPPSVCGIVPTPVGRVKLTGAREAWRHAESSRRASGALRTGTNPADRSAGRTPWWTSHEFRPRREKTPAKPRGAKAALWIAVLVVLGVVLFFPVALATDRSTFCRTCHEMIPYYDAWLVGQHAKTAECIDCHVDAGLPARFAHKFVALGEVKSHVLGDTSFPREQPPNVPNKRCTRCHETLPKTSGRRLLARDPRREGNLRHLSRHDGPQRDGRGAQGGRYLQRHRCTRAQEPARSRWSTEARPTSRATRRSAARAATTWRRRGARAATR